MGEEYNNIEVVNNTKKKFEKYHVPDKTRSRSQVVLAGASKISLGTVMTSMRVKGGGPYYMTIAL